MGKKNDSYHDAYLDTPWPTKHTILCVVNIALVFIANTALFYVNI